MRFSARTWSLLSLLLFVAAAFFWLKGNEYEARKRLAPPAVLATNPPTAALDLFSTRSTAAQLASLTAGSAASTTLHPITTNSIRNGEVDPAEIEKRFPHRLRNTQKPLRELVRDDKAVLLANALIDTTGAVPEIPRHLRAEGDPGSYIVQWSGPADARFRSHLSDLGAEIISYVPNNAYFVKVDKIGADQLSVTPGVQSVLPFQPYYKLDPSLIGFAVKQEALPAGATLRLTFLPGSVDIAQQVAALGVDVVAEEPSPFGPQLIVNPGPHALVSLAQLSSVQGIERSSARMRASDLSRIALGVATNGSAPNYLGLSGAGVLVNINDTGIQPDHPTLTDTTIHLPAPPLRGFMTANDDPDGHGTFVASLIAGSGASTPSAYQTNTIPGTNGAPSTTVITPVLPGSSTNANLRGIAHNSDLLALPLDPGGNNADVFERLLDTWLIESAARSNYVTLDRTNTMISNNSWTYGVTGYDSSAARFDQAVRDSLPGATADQPLLFVFAAGNSGFGEDDGLGGSFDSIESPGTAKNVITVGALESPRFITNVFYTLYHTNYSTNVDGTISTNTETENIYPFAGVTDSDDEVAEFSSRGNVGIGIEGDMGRFKPDVVAPGTMLIAARSAGWDFNGFNTNDTNFGQMYYNLHTNLQPYRFDSGSTFAAANVSGMLALMQEYFQARAPDAARRSLSPALMKALLINGARSLSRNYDIAAKSAANYQGWGLPNLPNSLTSYTTNEHSGVTEKKWRLRTVEQSAENALATGQSRTWNVTLSSNAISFPLRATLVWTDPPGNPAVAVKLVNDLDLVVTNLDTGFIYYGNNILFGSDATTPSEPDIDPVITDVINNVEQVMVEDPSLLGNRFSITVRARRVNVNSVNNYLSATRNTNDVVQDYALVISSEIGANPELNDPDPTNPEGYLPNVDVFDEFERVASSTNVELRALTTITNGLPLIDQRAGANPSLIGTNGTVAQWNFYVFTNVNVSNALVTTRVGSNVAFVTFNPPNLSRPRALEADIDLYVSDDPRLTNLHPAAVAGAFKSVLVGGTESVIFTNALIGDIFYVGVKAEDQQGAEFSLIGVSSDEPFEQERNGRIYLTGVPFEAAVLDGNPRRPTAGTMLAIGLSNRRIAHAQVTTTTFHENHPDLLGLLTKQRTRVVLNNHSGTNIFGTNTYTYEDNPMFEIPGVTRPSDGPGSLIELVGYKIVGPWFLEMIDNSPSHTGRVQRFEVVIDPLRDDIPIGVPFRGEVEPGQMAFYPLDVPPGATNLNFLFTEVTGPLQFYWREGLLPTTNLFDEFRNISPPGADFDIAVTGGRTYYMGLRNPGASIVSFALLVTADFGDTNFNRFYAEKTVGALPDDSTSSSVIDVGVDKLVSDVLVGVQMKHPRTADLALTLISPQGSRILLVENRGQTNIAGFGSTSTVTNRSPSGATNLATEPNFVVFTDRTNLARIPVKFANPGSSDAFGGLSFTSTFETDSVGNFRSGASLDEGWEVTPGGQISIINGAGLGRNSSTLASLGTAGISREFATTVGRPLIVRFATRRAALMDFFSTGVTDSTAPLPSGFPDGHYHLADGPTGPSAAYVLFADEPPFSPPTSWTLNGGLQTIGGFSQWITPYTRVPLTNDATGEFVFRTYINLYENTPAGFARQFRWSGDDIGNVVRINGNPFPYPGGVPSDFWNSPVHRLPRMVPGLNIIDFIVEDEADAEGLRVDVIPVPPAQRLRKSPIAEMTVTVGGIPRTVRATNTWVEHVFTFSPSSATDILSFQTSTGEVWIDSISVESSGGVFLHPEEPFELLEDERAMGEWRLEVRDTRTGAILPTSEVLEWSLELAFADTRNLALMMKPDDLVGPITLRTNQVQWVVLDPCQGATFARLTLEGIGNFGELLLFADLNGFPTGNPELDDFIPIANDQNPGQANGRLTFELSTLLPAPARLTGKPIFIGIINQFQDATNRFELFFESDGDCTIAGPPPILNPDDPEDGQVDPDPSGGSNTNNIQGLYQFTIPPNALAANIEVDSSGDVTVYGQKDIPPSSTVFTHSTNGVIGAGTENLRVATNSVPPLTPGTYFVRIVNNTQQTVDFTVTVSFEFGGPQGQIVLTVVMLNGRPQLTWSPTEPGATYIVEATTNLATGPWDPIDTRVAVGTSDSIPINPATPYRFFRIRRP